jgi:hypothetical protein
VEVFEKLGLVKFTFDFVVFADSEGRKIMGWAHYDLKSLIFEGLVGLW